MIDAYRLTDSLAGKAYCRVKRDLSVRWVALDLARWGKYGETIQLTETIAKPFASASAITHLDSLANAAVAEDPGRIAAAQRKVNAWPSVGSDPDCGNPTKAPLPAQRGGVKQISREELEKLSSGAGPVFVDSGAQPVDQVLRRNRARFHDDEFVQWHYQDDEQQALSEAFIGYHEIDGTELET